MGDNTSYPDWYDRAYERLVDEEGDDFCSAMNYNDQGEHEPEVDMFGELSGAAQYYLTDGTQRQINSDRLRYTTQGPLTMPLVF